MPTFEILESFQRDYKRLGVDASRAFETALVKFIEDLTNMEQGSQAAFRAGLRVKPLKGRADVLEMTWDGNDGRATFSYGAEIKDGKTHVVWRRVGTHSIFEAP